MNIDTTVYAYQYQAQILCDGCTVETLIAQHRAAPAAREMLSHDVVDAVAEAEALTGAEQDDSERLPQALSAYSGLVEGERCGNCGEVVFE